MHLIPTGLPSGIPGPGEEIDRAIQQAPQFSRQSIMFYIISKGSTAQWRNGAMAQWRKGIKSATVFQFILLIGIKSLILTTKPFYL
jgi:hypothetical protein